MNLKAHLTVGWEQAGQPRAYDLDQKALASGSGTYATYLVEALSKEAQVYGTDELFYRRVNHGFKPIKRFMAALTEDNSAHPLICHIDVFAYSFLKKAKNFDLFLPESEKADHGFRKDYESEWRQQIDRMENFELFGKTIPEDEKQRYLALRQIALRKSARDEWRAIASLIQSGPTTMEGISGELALGYTLGPRLLKPFVDLGAVAQSDSDGRYQATIEALPVLLYFLRELLGLDLLGGL